ncbi:hypothetical protein [Clostridium luticellarii]|jgi:energy-coupling factor transport system ATP-binding protein|nr:hypothetical protein [Clostridium luticellarii]MCI1944755.1 hypothetical protein [Clostridium luticellarii]MCI1968250.1 hypothetical protein [Clostridium luticellarii]
MSYIGINNLNFTYPLEKKRSLKNVNLSLEKNDFLPYKDDKRRLGI